jgi:hypothetical protein
MELKGTFFRRRNHFLLEMWTHVIITYISITKWSGARAKFRSTASRLILRSDKSELALTDHRTLRRAYASAQIELVMSGKGKPTFREAPGPARRRICHSRRRPARASSQCTSTDSRNLSTDPKMRLERSGFIAESDPFRRPSHGLTPKITPAERSH